ncbi:N-acetyl-gamma-glutamyl-phosphate reductase [Pirellulaceae bacterium SH449]
MVRLGILGANDPRMLVAMEWLMRHPNIQISAVAGTNCAGNMMDDRFPRLINRLKMPFMELSPYQLAEQSDVVVSFLPHGESLRACIEIVGAGCKFIDLSPDYRLSNSALYERWYGEKHIDPTKLGQVPYGIYELFGETFSKSSIVACPGPFAVPTILCLLPLIKEHLVKTDEVIVDIKAGVRSLDEKPHPSTQYYDRNENVEPFAVGSHRQQAEICDVIASQTKESVGLSFTPHLVPMERGMFSTIYLSPSISVSANQIRECLLSYYEHFPFVRIVSHLPTTQCVLRSNYIDVAIRENGPKITILAATDSAIRGGIGTAIQAINGMFGFEATTGLVLPGQSAKP